MNVLGAEQTAELLPYGDLVGFIESTSMSSEVNVPQRNVYSITSDNRFFVMPAYDDLLCVTKLITHAPRNSSLGIPAILGHLAVFDVETGDCRLVLDGPTVTARRTAAVTGLFLRCRNDRTLANCLIVGAGVQGHSHLDMLVDLFNLQRVSVLSRTLEGASRLAAHARKRGVYATALQGAPELLDPFDLIITCTPAQEIVIRHRPRSNAILCAIGAYRPSMLEWDPDIVRWVAQTGSIFVDTRDADHEAGDILQAGLTPSSYLSLAEVLSQPGVNRVEADKTGPILFKSCGWAGWDLAAAKCAVQRLNFPGR